MGSSGKLSVVATPIGHMGDMSLRAASCLSEVDFILCEDTRRSGLFLSQLGIKRPLVSYFAHNERLRCEQIVSRLVDGEQAALISDAGTPCISDPGHVIVDACHGAGVQVSVVPGPSAVVSAVCVSGFSENRFLFEGFFPRRYQERVKLFEWQKRNQSLMVGYESGQRIFSLLEVMLEVLGEEWLVCVCRELTKKFEEIIRCRLGDAVGLLEERVNKGEFCLVIDSGKMEAVEDDEGRVEALIEALVLKGLSARDIKDVVSAVFHVDKKALYRKLHGLE